MASVSHESDLEVQTTDKQINREHNTVHYLKDRYRYSHLFYEKFEQYQCQFCL
jgi:hypothetical protein